MSDTNQPIDYHAYRPWEHQATFNDVLAEQLRRAPYLLASALIHVIIGFILASMMLLTRDKQEVPTIIAAPPPPPPEVVEEEEPPPPPPEEEVVEEPVIQEAVIEETTEQEMLEETGDPDANADAPFESNSGWNNAVGLGGGAGGKYGGRGGRGGKRGVNSTEQAVADALKWLYDHQAPSGFWDADEFMAYDKYPSQPASDGKGNPVVDVGLTGLAILAFTGNGNTLAAGPYRETVAKGTTWLKEVQRDDGLFGDEVGNPTLYNHAIATMALGEVCYFANKPPTLTAPLKKAVAVILNSRNNYGAWRYQLEPNGDNDTSITGWMIFALKTAEDCKIPVDKGAYDGALTWFDAMEDKNSGRVGYAWGDGGGGPGSLPSRPVHMMEKFPADKSESLTAVALLCRIFMTDTSKVKQWKDHPNYAVLKKNADLIASKLPKWDSDGSIDIYYWYYATFAMNQWGEQHWKNWEKAIGTALVPNQRRDTPDKKDNFYGSWDPADAWGEDGGRVYSTATCALILEVYYRYAKVLGAR